MQGDTAQALHAYDQALRLDPPNTAWAHNGYGLVLKAIGRLQRGAESRSSARRVTSRARSGTGTTSPKCWSRCASTRKRSQPAKQAVLVDPTHAFSWAKLGQVLRYLHRYEEALDAYDHAVDLKPNYAWAINGKGIVLEQLERYDEALACYRKAADVAGADVWHWYNHGNVLALLGRYDEALPALQQAIESTPRSRPQLGATRQRAAPVEALRRGAGGLSTRH